MTTPKYLILDLETTGLDPNTCEILEVGAILVDGALRELSRLHLIKHYPRRFVSTADPFVQKMHTKNGLWVECESARASVAEVDQAFGVWLDLHAGRGNQLILAGGSPGSVDVPFTKRYMPRLTSWLSYRTVDISGLAREAAEVGFSVPTTYNVGNPLEEHRAMPDCVAELELWRTVRKVQREALDAATYTTELDF